MITQMRNLDVNSLREYRDFMIRSHTESIKAASTLPIHLFTALSFKVTRKLSSTVSDRPQSIIKKIIKRTSDRSAFLMKEYGVVKAYHDTLQGVDANVSTDFGAVVVNDMAKDLTNLLYVYEDFLPFQIDVDIYSDLLVYRGHIMQLIRGEALRDLKEVGVTSRLNIVPDDLISRLACSSHWPALVFHLKKGANRRMKRQRVVLTALYDEITKIRMRYIEKGNLSNILDQTGYDIVVDDDGRVEENTRPEESINIIVNEIGPDIEEHFEGVLRLDMLLVGLIEAVKLMGVEDVCLIHHYSD